MTMLATCLDLIVALALVGVGVAVVRPAKGSAGMLFAGAGLLELVGSCCTRAFSMDLTRAYSGEEPLTVGRLSPETFLLGYKVSTFLGIAEHLLAGLLIVGALAMLASAARAAPRDAPPG